MSSVTLEQAEDIATLTLNRPERGDALGAGATAAARPGLKRRILDYRAQLAARRK